MTTEVQTCYRHGDRRAGVSCQRCGRPICPACMTQASVGFHCPECLRSSTQRVVSARTVAQLGTPYVTYALVAVNTLIYFATQNDRAVEIDFALVGDFRGIGVAAGEWYRIVTGGFLHANITHLLFNMFALYVLGRQLEPVIGRVSFLLVYVSSLLAGSLGVLVADPQAITVGASGAVFGLFGFALAAQRARGINPMDTGLGGIILINLLFTFLVPGISIGGHVGGLLGGMVAGQLLEAVGPRLDLPRPAAAALVAALGVVCAAGSLYVGASL